MDELLKESKLKKVKTIKKKSINRVVTEIALRRNKGEGHNLDQRYKSPTKYKEKGLLTGTKGTLEKNLIPNLDYCKNYHDEQYKLFDKLPKIFPKSGFLTNVEQRKDEKGRWFLYRNNKKFTTTQFLNFIDKITLEYIEQLSGITKKTPDLQTIAESCQTIVMLRYLGNINFDTDFLKDEKTKLWRNHVAIILSFSALLVILEMMKLKFSPQSKPNQTIKRKKKQPKSPRRELVPDYRFCFYLKRFLASVLSFAFKTIERLAKSLGFYSIPWIWQASSK